MIITYQTFEIDYVSNAPEFPCWTNVMQDHFKNPRLVATSAHSETYFAQTKSSLDGIQRVDKAFIKHCRTIDADMKLARAAINNQN